eukprot:COSAG01_NODE_2443_length_7689_cov_5.414229_1_plen_183_part_00
MRVARRGRRRSRVRVEELDGGSSSSSSKDVEGTRAWHDQRQSSNHAARKPVTSGKRTAAAAATTTKVAALAATANAAAAAAGTAGVGTMPSKRPRLSLPAPSPDPSGGSDSGSAVAFLQQHEVEVEPAEFVARMPGVRTCLFLDPATGQSVGGRALQLTKCWRAPPPSANFFLSCPQHTARP